eukprot:TRINITY_DN104762_c0_g1_i1.p1 TRINITY_DN104762_c0_g1~~TRINITY_DN104762_c0_g1_i1.p1  ORF type:complete len:261 (-),score=17.66 TRINITY_DN104762_c0_g1_i1:61-843(-)
MLGSLAFLSKAVPRAIFKARPALGCVPYKCLQPALSQWLVKNMACRCFAAVSGDVIVADVAAYIHNEINGTFDDIYKKLYDLVDILEYPNDGSITRVSMSDAKVMIEEVGACPETLETFLAEKANDVSTDTLPAERNDQDQQLTCEAEDRHSGSSKIVYLNTRLTPLPQYDFLLPPKLQRLQDDDNCKPTQLAEAIRSLVGEENVVRLKTGTYIITSVNNGVVYRYALVGSNPTRAWHRSHKTFLFNALAHMGIVPLRPR